jgi:predicted  nucleic acid-binding Zn-ribbon protein
MPADRYAVLMLAKGATVSECQDCGAVVFHRVVHDAWHAYSEREASAVACLLARLVRLHEPDVEVDVDGLDQIADEADAEVEAVEAFERLETVVRAKRAAGAAIDEYRSDGRRN